LTILLDTSCKLDVFTLRPLPFLQSSGHRVMPSFTAVLVRSPGELCCNSTPAKLLVGCTRWGRAKWQHTSLLLRLRTLWSLVSKQFLKLRLRDYDSSKINGHRQVDAAADSCANCSSLFALLAVEIRNELPLARLYQNYVRTLGFHLFTKFLIFCHGPFSRLTPHGLCGG
jgi:hypothetical protein